MKSGVYRTGGEAGLSLLEVLVVVAGIAIMAAVGMVQTGNIKERVVEQKLAQDVETINRAIKVYEGMGGTWTGIPADPQWILGALKTTETDVDQVTGLTGALVDPRLQIELMGSSAELASDAPRAVWNGSKGRFVVINDNSIAGAKVKRFERTDDSSWDEFVTTWFETNMPNRKRDNRAFDYAGTGKWVWDYEDTVASPGPSPTGIPLLPGAPPPPPPPSPETPLSPPGFSIGGGSYVLTSYPMGVTLANPNIPAVSEVYYYTALTGWNLYSGASIPIEPGTQVTTFAKSTDPDWTDSPVVDAIYDANSVTLEIGVTGPGSVTWGQVGGALMPGGPAPAVAPQVLLSLANEASIPDSYESSAYFAVYRTTDGGNPLDAASDRTVSPAFSGGFPTETIDISLAVWGTQTSLDVQAAAESFNPGLFNNSGTEQLVVGIARTMVRDPMITDLGNGTAKIDLDASFGDMPAGARVYYTLDGTDPGDAGGDPIAGTEYTVPFSVKYLGSSPVIRVTARAYGTDSYEHWFDSSSTVRTDVPVPPPVVTFSHAASTSPPL